MKGWLIFAVFVAISLIILSPAYVGFLHEMRGYSDRSGAVPRAEAVNTDALDPKALSTFASPYRGDRRHASRPPASGRPTSP